MNKEYKPGEREIIRSPGLHGLISALHQPRRDQKSTVKSVRHTKGDKKWKT
jgi:hypothetical protein